jgi:hypothetical protein
MCACFLRFKSQRRRLGRRRSKIIFALKIKAFTDFYIFCVGLLCVVSDVGG